MPYDIVKEVTKGSSRWIKTQGPEFGGSQWRAGYGAFSVSPIHEERVRACTLDQEARHRKVTFQDKCRKLLKDCRISSDERYVRD